ncbi:T9SS type A sorting domain-containing protein [candidate division WOR-3 bacterium]|nr:T9SS type A sorting domain-containing protein [candidate division WOR-3 bacterium]
MSSFGNNWHGFPSVCYGDTVYFTSWWDNRSGNYYDDIYGARVSTQGITLDTAGIAVCTAQDSQFFSAVSYDGTNFLVVWDDWRNHNWDIFGSRVNESGVVLDSSGFIVSTASFHQRTPAIVFNGVDYFVVWSDYRNSSWDIYGTRLSQNGVILDPDGIAISTAPGEQTNPSIAFDGVNYIVVWQDYRSGSWDIYGAKLDTSGTTVDSFEVSTQSGDQVEPEIVNGSDDQILIVYTGWTDTINGHFVNTMRIWGKFYRFVGTEEENRFIALDIRSNFSVFPNPLHRQCILEYSVPTKTRVNASIYDAAGRLSIELIDEIQDVGIYRKNIDMTSLPQGVYFIRLQSSSQPRIRKIILLK